MIRIPKEADLQKLGNLTPTDEIIDHLAECVKGTEKHTRKSSVTVTYKFDWNEDHTAIELSTIVKSKRPVREDRNEERLGEEAVVCRFKDEDARQQRLEA